MGMACRPFSRFNHSHGRTIHHTPTTAPGHRGEETRGGIHSSFAGITRSLLMRNPPTECPEIVKQICSAQFKLRDMGTKQVCSTDDFRQSSVGLGEGRLYLDPCVKIRFVRHSRVHRFTKGPTATSARQI